MIEHFKNDLPSTQEEFGVWWNTLQVELRGRTDVPLKSYQWTCPVADTCFTLVPEWMLTNDTLLQFLRDSTRDYVLDAKRADEEGPCPNYEDDEECGGGECAFVFHHNTIGDLSLPNGTYEEEWYECEECGLIAFDKPADCKMKYPD